MSEAGQIDDTIVRDVKSFIEDDEDKLRIIERIVEKDKNSEGAWEASEVLKPGYIGSIKAEPFVNVALDTNSANLLELKDTESVEYAVEEVKGKPDEFSDEWFSKKRESNLDDFFDNIEVSEEDEEEIHRITEDSNALDYWSQYIAPSLKYREQAKKCALIMLASPEDKYNNKGRINLFIHGESGTGKTVIKDYLSEEFGAQTIDGPRVSKADITYNKNTGELGQLPKAHGGIIAIEEADEMDEEPVGAALTALGESGKVEIRDMTIPAAVRGVVLSNFDSIDQAIRQWSEESLNRFDFIINFERLPDDKKDEALDWHYDNFRKPNPQDNIDLLKKYLKLVRDYEPEIDELEEIKQFKRKNVDEIENVRRGISIMNIAWTIARLNFSDVELHHYKKAFDLVATQ